MSDTKKSLLFRLHTFWWKRKKKNVKNEKDLPLHLLSGIKGEAFAAEYMEKKGFRIVARNYAVGKSEIDIIAENKELFVFCEVKTRTQRYGANSPYGTPVRAVTREKRRHLIPATTLFCRKHRDAGKCFRFDVLEVYLNPDHSLGHITHYENIFIK